MTDPDSRAEPRRRTSRFLWNRFARSFRRLGPSEDEINDALRDVTDDADMETARKDMILKAARFDNLRVLDVMRPRADIVGVEANATLGEAARIFSESQHSRLPIYRDTLDDPLGFVHVRDVMALLAPSEDGQGRAKLTDRALTRIRRDILYVPQSMRLSSLLLKMQSSRIHIALVVDEYGGTDGLVSMEDVVEQIVGEIEDEHDIDAPLIQERPAGAFEADGRADIDKLEAALKASLELPEHEDEFDTVGGLAVALAGRLPQRGEILHHPAGFDVEVIDADPRRVKRVRVKPAPNGATASATPAPAASPAGPDVDPARTSAA
jgi:CBS domain containing-hemolysin-like protein